MGALLTALKFIGISILVLVGLGLSYQYIATKLDQRKYPPVGKLVDVGAYKLHMIEQRVDHSGPTIILESGFGGNCLSWSLVQPEIAKFARVISYDRAGYGWSDASPLVRSNKNIVNELHVMLENAGIPKPYILVGHSRGGLNVRLFAMTYPDEVAGVILVDTRHENQSGQYPEPLSTQWNKYYIFLKSYMIGCLGYDRLLLNLSSVQKDLLEHIEKYSESVQNMFSSRIVTAKFKVATAQEELYHNQNCHQLKLTGGSLQDMPLMVITAGKPFLGSCMSDDINKYWQYYQKELLTKSSRSKQLIAEHSGHDIPYDQPEIIVDAVRKMYIEYNLEHFDDVWGQLGDPILVEQRFLELLPQAQQLENKSIYLQMLSQVALAQAVLKKFDAAHATLYTAEKLLTPEYDLAKVRILCERGRTFQQAGDLVQARIHFEQSYELSDQCQFDKQTINAAHMIAIVAPMTAEKIAWNKKALDLAMNSNDVSAQSWQAPLLNNLGANYLEDQQLEKALDAFEQALIAFEKSPEYKGNTRFARFRVAQVLRMLSRLDEALAMQQEQLKEYDAITVNGQFDMPAEMFILMRGFVYEELVEIYAAKEDLADVKKYAQLALADLDNNQMFAIMDPTSAQRLERLKQIKN